MKLNLSILALLIISINAKAQSTVKNNFSNELSKPAAIFEENKGQMKDQHWKPRPDVLFYGSQAGMHYYIKNNGVSFQLSRVDSWREEDGHAGMPGKEKRQVPDQISTYRVDAHWISHNPDFDIERGKALDGYNNYYNVPDGADTALFVKQYEHVTLKNVWNGIDIHYYGTEGLLETDYLVSPGGDYSQIQMEIKGADLSISKDGHLIMKTPFGEIQEGELKVYQSDERLQAFWQIDDNNKVSFFIPNFNPALAMRIDPVTRVWGTYYGGLGDDYCNSIVTDALRNVYLAGKTSSTSAIASGGHQNTFGANTDAFLVKLDSIGVRQWGTYYGGTAISNEEGLSTTSDASGNIFLAGNTCCISNGIASGGHQNTSGGNSDAFLVKFSNNGVRQWGTYYGGSGNDYGLSTASDVSGNVYLAGHTVSPNAIASGGHQNTFGGGTADAFLVKFNSFGVRLWGTYYGGSSDEIFSSVSVSSGYVYLAGLTGSTTNIASGGHQNTYAGGPNMGDAYLVKFNSNGVRQWGTYYGGSGADIGYSTTTDFVGNVYLAGYTTSTSNIAAGGHQNTITGNSQSAFLVKFNSNGVRQWGTYYGGQNGDFGYSTCTDALGNVFLAGIGGSSPSLIASGGYQNTYMGGGDAFLVKFNNNGVRQWGTYYGGTGNESVFVSTRSDPSGNIYLGGTTNSTSNIASGGHQNFKSGMNDAFLVKFFETFITTQAPITMSTCPNSSVSFSLIASGVGLSYQWQSKSPSGTQFSNILSGGINNFSGVTTTSLSIGNPSGLDGYEFRCIVSNSLSSEISTTTVLTVYTIPTIQSQPISSTMCSGVSATFILGATGSGLTYQWQYGVNTSSFINLINGGTNSISGSNSSALVIGNTSGLSNYYFRCIVGSSLCPSTATSNFAQLTVINIPTIVTQPASVTVCPNQIANLTLSASGTGLTYQWQNRMGSSGSWVNCSNGAIYSGSTANTLQILNLTGLNNYQYRCVVTNSNACSATSNAVLLTVYTTPSAIITADGGSANPVTINFGDASALLLSGSINSANPNILWTPAVGLSSTTVADPIAYPTNSTNYTVTFTNTNGCTQTVSQQVNVNPLPNNGTISVVSATGLNSFNLFDTLKVEVRLIGASDIYAAYARLRYSGALASNLTYVGYTTGTILGTGAAVISTPPVSSGTYGYDFGISKIGAVPGYSGTGTLYTFFFKPNNIPSSLSGSQVCFFVDNLSITNATSGTPVGLVNQGPSCFNYSSQINVWPGDLDNNKTVNTSDLLKIGIFYNNTGPIRPNANLQWVAQPASLWGFNTSSPNSDAFKVFADGNGDGIINNADQTSVGFNIGKIHPFVSPLDSLDGSGFQRISATGNLTLIPTPGYVNTSQLPQQVELQVNLTNTGGTLDNLYGISFDITVDTNVFDLQNTTFDYGGTIFGVPAQDFLSIEYVANGVVSVGMTRYNNPAINGNGLLCKVRLNTYPTLNYPDTNLVFTGTVMAANDSIGTPVTINPTTFQIPYGVSASLMDATSGNFKMLLYPNPVDELLNLLFDKQVLIREIKVLDGIGRVVAVQTPNQRIRTYLLNTADLVNGIYTLQLTTRNGYIYEKFIKAGN